MSLFEMKEEDVSSVGSWCVAASEGQGDTGVQQFMPLLASDVV